MITPLQWQCDHEEWSHCFGEFDKRKVWVTCVMCATPNTDRTCCHVFYKRILQHQLSKLAHSEFVLFYFNISKNDLQQLGTENSVQSENRL